MGWGKVHRTHDDARREAVGSRVVALALVVVASLGALSACGGDGSGPRSSAAGDDASFRYGDGVAGPSSSTTAPMLATTTAVAASPATSAPSAGAATAAPPPAPARGSTVANRTERVDADSGLRLVLVAGGATTFKTTDRVAFELTFENTATTTRYHDSNQDLRFALFRADDGSAAWENRACRGAFVGQRPTTGVLELGPGERGSFIDEYPSSAAPDPSACRVSAGEYQLVGVLDWCPEETLARSDYNGQPYCDRAHVRQLQSTPLKLTFVAG